MRSIPIVGDAVLDPITTSDLENEPLMVAISRWRNAAAAAFLTQFEATPERTKRWLAERVLPDPRRLLFVVNDGEGPLGTLGLIGLNGSGAELDNLLRGERRGPASLFREAEAALIRWLFHDRGVERIEAAVFSWNFAALQLHQSLGFTVERRIPLRRTATADMICWVEAPEAEGGVYHLRLALEPERFTP